ncbi:hypothetical protein THRCLA_05482 [Thraustotheca clavata]|uniref:Uncharacterized protein n=1 Tax=Thraustotheca clavata TaxID=74557 RepID=A0A1V9ZVS1_9STRA|nr:hypothetical protein THRCLA_05482 [Thraustotheca clavata]
MLVLVLSPAKTLEMTTASIAACTSPKFITEASVLIKELRQFSVLKLKKLLGTSDAITKLNYDRYKNFVDDANVHEPSENFKQALLAFNGPAYKGIQAEKFTTEDMTYTQKHLRILCGLYGILRPLDLIQPYRLEMGQKLPNPNGKDLYEFWADTISQELNALFASEESKILLNVASQEYFKSIDLASLDPSIQVIDCVFKDDGKIKSVYAKRARGLMVHYAMTNRASTIEDIQAFDLEGYVYSAKESNATTLIFNRSKQSLKRHNDSLTPSSKKIKK